jgi:N-acetylmuramoyl-L-alanine amidase
MTTHCYSDQQFPLNSIIHISLRPQNPPILENIKNLAIKFTVLLLLVSLCISCGVRNVSYGPPEREIEKLHTRADVAYNRLLEGKTGSSRRRWKNLIRQFEEIAKDYPRSRFADDAQYKVGSCYIQASGVLEDSPQKAVDTFEHLIKRYPDSEFVDDAHYWKAYAYFLKKDYMRSMAEYKKFMTDYPESEFYQEAERQMDACQANLGIPKRKQQQTAPRPQTFITPTAIAKEIGDTTEKTDSIARQSEDILPEPVESDSATPEKEDEQPPEVPTKGMEDRQIQVEPFEHVSVDGIRFHSWPEFTRVVIDLSKQVEYKADRLAEPDRIYLDLQMASIAPDKQIILIDDMVIENIRSAQFDEHTVRVVLDIKQAHSYDVFYLENPVRLVVDVYPNGSGSPLSLSPSRRRESLSLVEQLGLKVKTIVIDPGHGGRDPGAVSESGLMEKDVVLDIAKRVKTLLERGEDYQVYLTRESDIYVPLEGRTAFANLKEADLFISIHINAGRRKGARGIETFYLSMASDEEASLTAALENASSGKTINDLSSLLRDILKVTRVDESRDLAGTIQSCLCHRTEAEDRGVKRAPFIVLIGARAPSILVELGFMSNKQDERLLKREEYKDKLARALAEAVEDYVESRE